MTIPVASVIIPAHNEEAVIGRLLQGLVTGSDDTLEILVICNGCTDRTAAIAGAYIGDVHVVEIDEASKRLALARGDTDAVAFPRLFIDADVEITATDVLKLVDALAGESVLAAVPERHLPMDGVSRWVRWYYDVWSELPQVRGGLFGRGVIGVSEAGNERVQSLPPSMGDDLIASEAFEPEERVVVGDATVTVHPPKSLRDLHRRRIRAATGNAQADQRGLRRAESMTAPSTLASMVMRRPTLVLRLPVFLASAGASRWVARRAIRSGDFDTWLRDESSRSGD